MSLAENPPQWTLLQSQDEFEVLLGRQPAPPGFLVPSFVIVYFTAKWCGACKRLDLQTIRNSAPDATWLKCDVDMNQYTLGFCGLRSIPSFVAIKDMKVVGSLSDSRTEKVLEWLKTFVKSV